MDQTQGAGHYHLDPLGTVTDVTDTSGVAQWKYEYEAFGGERSATNVSGSAPENRVRFNHQYLDAETMLYQLRAREYDSATGRFGALDPVENALGDPYMSAYVYANAQPTVLVDPSGRAVDRPPDCEINVLWATRTPSRGVKRLDVIARGRCLYRSAYLVVLGVLQAWNRPDQRWNAVGRFRGARTVGRYLRPIAAVLDQPCLSGLRFRATINGFGYYPDATHPVATYYRHLVTCP